MATIRKQRQPKTRLEVISKFSDQSDAALVTTLAKYPVSTARGRIHRAFVGIPVVELPDDVINSWVKA